MKLSAALPLFLGLAPSRRPSSVTTARAFSLNRSTVKNPNAFGVASRKERGLPFAVPLSSATLTAFRGGSSTTGTAISSSVTSTEESSDATIIESQPLEIFRNDYKPVPFKISKISMDFNISPKETIVTSELYVESNPKSKSSPDELSPLVLDGDDSSVKLLSISVDGTPLVEGEDYTVTPTSLTILRPSDKSTITTVVEIHPDENTQLSGLYASSSMYCSQCEAMGFRRITYYPDRPDNMAIFERVRVEAPLEGYSSLLSNGNLLETGQVGEDRHYAVWSDPYPKPSYLFALVAGSLGSVEDKYVTKSGREVHLEIYSEKENVDRLGHAMESLKKSMKWDEDVFGLEYDLDLYNIVAVNDFNMGAMENKGLNVFNTAYVLASPLTATDMDFQRIEAVIGHEYFHNWTGNRVTCRDWFQLTLKEGLTVFRDQEFTGDMIGSKSTKRIEDVRTLRDSQFKEDAGPMKHPVRPESYISMDNFYTATVYYKGAEVVRMYHTMLTPSGFQKGMDLYFQRHDGDAVSCDDFRNAMADANDLDLSQFARWYTTPGTPTLTYSTAYDPETKEFQITFQQESASTEGPMHIPISVGLLDAVTGEEIVPTTVLELKEAEKTFTFKDLPTDKIIPSILRNFSAPVKLVKKMEDGEDQEQEWSFLASNDTDGFNKWEAGQKLYTNAIFKILNGDEGKERTLSLVEEAFGGILKTESIEDHSIMSYALTFPSESTLSEDMTIVDPMGLHQASGTLKKHMANKFKTEIASLYNTLTKEIIVPGEDYLLDAASVGKRRLRNVLLDFLISVRDTDEQIDSAAELAWTHYSTATGMTDKMAGLGALASIDHPRREEALQDFYEKANGDPLVINKWFTVQALADVPDVLDRVKALIEHPDFTMSNPNRARSLISAFSVNESHFHVESGEGYKFVGDMVMKQDEINPQLSSRTARSLIGWRRYDEGRGEKMREQLKILGDRKGISDDLFEIVTRGLK